MCDWRHPLFLTDQQGPRLEAAHIFLPQFWASNGDKSSSTSITHITSPKACSAVFCGLQFSASGGGQWPHWMVAWAWPFPTRMGTKQTTCHAASSALQVCWAVWLGELDAIWNPSFTQSSFEPIGRRRCLEMVGMLRDMIFFAFVCLLRVLHWHCDVGWVKKGNAGWLMVHGYIKELWTERHVLDFSLPEIVSNQKVLLMQNSQLKDFHDKI